MVRCVCDCVWWESEGISNSQLFPRHEEKGGLILLLHSEGCFLSGWAVLQPQPGSPGSPRVLQDERTSPVPALQSTGPLWTAFFHTHPHAVTGSLTLLQLQHKLGIPAAGCQLYAAPPWRFPAPLWPRFPNLYKEVGLGDLPGPFRSHKLALTPHLLGRGTGTAGFSRETGKV